MNDNINIRPIENGYIVSIWRSEIGSDEQYYCIDFHEINRRVEQLLTA